MVTQELEQDIGGEPEAISEEVVEETVAQEEEPVAKESTVTLTEDELRTRIQTEADRQANKSVQTYQKNLEEATRKIDELTSASEKREREAELARREGRELEEWGDTPEVKEFHRTRREFDTWMSDVQSAYGTFKAEKENVQKESNANLALKLAIQYGMEGGEEVVKGLEDFIKVISEGKNPAEMELKALRDSLKKTVKGDTPKRIVPDSSRKSAPGGFDLNKLHGDDALREGLKQEKEKRR